MDDVVGYFKRLKAQQEANKREYGDKYQDSDFVCVWPDGRIILPGYVSHNFKKLLAKYDLPEIRFHDAPDIIGLNQNPVQTGADLVLYFYFQSKNKTNRGEPSFFGEKAFDGLSTR